MDLHSSVDALMLMEVGHLAEGPSALSTFVGLLTRVDALVLGEVHALVVALPALPTLKRLLPRVDAPVLDEVRGLKEKLAAVVTPVTSLATGVGLPVPVGDGLSLLGRVLP